MPAKLSFNQKILLAACLVVIAAFAAFSVYNDYLQRRTLQANLDTYLSDAGTLTADNISNWLSGRILLLENLAQNLQSEPAERLVPLLEQAMTHGHAPGSRRRARAARRYSPVPMLMLQPAC